MSILKFAICVVALSTGAAAQSVSIHMEGAAFRVLGWDANRGASPDGWPSLFAVFAGAGDVPPMLGDYTLEEGALVFRPRFPLAPGVRYRAVFHPPAGADVEAVFDIPKARTQASTRVDHVYPSTDLLPDNQLKFYLYFSAPMRRGDAWRHIHLLDDRGAAVELPFLEIDQELWDPDYRRLTVLFDPGRIKRGLLPLQEVGPAIEEGKRYTLVIDRDWQDAGGAPLAEGFRKVFRVGPADRTPPDQRQWRVTAPRAGATGAVTVTFPKPLDYALLMHLLQVSGPAGAVAGAVTVDAGETRWSFTPQQPWKAGDYRILVDTALEDLAGNRIGRPFDVDTFKRVSRHVPRGAVSLPFRVRQQ